MRVRVNGDDRDLADDTTVAVLLGDRTRGSAVVVDGVIVPRGDWPTYRLQPGQQVELITAVPGG